MTKSWHEMTALELGHLIENGSIDPIDLAQYFLARIKSEDPESKIFVRLTEERALGEAKAAAIRARSGVRLSPLDGVPISWKDLFDTAGVATEAGTKLMQGRTPTADAVCLTRATRAGLVCLGKTAMPDVAFSGLGINPWTGVTPNPYDPYTLRVAGGSSTGAALSVAHRLAPAAIGSDTAGSVRIPSAWCNLTGFKPTFGRISLKGTVPLSYTQDSVGPLTRDVADAAMLYSILAGGQSIDLKEASLKGVRILRPTSQFDTVSDPAITAQVGRGLAQLKAAGAEVIDGPVPALDDMAALCAKFGTPASIEACMMYGDMIRARPGDVYGPIAERILGAAKFSGTDLAALYRGIEKISRDYLSQTAGFDLVAGPTEPEHPPAIAPLLDDMDNIGRIMVMPILLTRFANLLGLCAISLPCGKDQGLPVGLMLMAPGNSEGKLLRLSAAAEQALAPLND